MKKRITKKMYQRMISIFAFEMMVIMTQAVMLKAEYMAQRQKEKQYRETRKVKLIGQV